MMDTLTKELYEEVTNLLHDMGTPAHIKGHYYLRSAILEVYAHPELLKNMMNGWTGILSTGWILKLGRTGLKRNLCLI